MDRNFFITTRADAIYSQTKFNRMNERIINFTSTDVGDISLHFQLKVRSCGASGEEEIFVSISRANGQIAEFLQNFREKRKKTVAFCMQMTLLMNCCLCPSALLQNPKKFRENYQNY